MESLFCPVCGKEIKIEKIKRTNIGFYIINCNNCESLSTVIPGEFKK